MHEKYSKQCMVEDDANNSLGFTTATDCWCFLVFSVRICKAQLSEWINLKLQHPTPWHLIISCAQREWGIWTGNVNFNFLGGSGCDNMSQNRWDLSYSVMEEFISKGIAFVNGWLVQQQLQKLHVCIVWYLLQSAAYFNIHVVRNKGDMK